MRTPLAILTDTTLCTGCEKCVEACRSEHNLGKDVPRRWKSRIDDLSSTRYTTIVRRRDEEKAGIRFVRQQCRHCADPACVSACLVGALQQPKDSKERPMGPVIYDSDKCIGCRYCMIACPYGIPRYDWDRPVPYIRKCDMCYARLIDDDGQLIEGGKPACVEACPEKATIFGPRDALIDEAHDRIDNNPGKYIDKVFGETEVGGTSVIYVSDVSLDFLAFKPELEDKPLPQLTLAALSKVPPLIVGVGGMMAGVWWIIGRRVKLAEEAAQQSSICRQRNPVALEATPSSETDEEQMA